jgi:hypothetical protein
VTDCDTVSYQVVFQRECHYIETVYWTGSLEETRELARRIAIQLAANDFRIIEFNRDAPEPAVKRGLTLRASTPATPVRPTLPRLDLGEPQDGKSSGRGAYASLGPKLQRGPRPPHAEAIRWVSALDNVKHRRAGGARIDLAQRSRVKCKAEGQCERRRVGGGIRTTPPLIRPDGL